MNDYTGKICPYCKTAFQPGDDVIVCSECEMPHHKDCWIENQGCTTFGCLGTINTADNATSSVTATQMNYEDTAAPERNSFVFCTQCGTKCASNSSFCTHCGAKLTSVSQRVPQPPVYTQANPNNHNPYAYVNQQSTPYQSTTVRSTPQPQSYQAPVRSTPQPQSYQAPVRSIPQAQSYQTNESNTHQAYQSPDIDADVQQLVGTNKEYFLPKFHIMKAQNNNVSWNWLAFLFTPYWLICRKMYGFGAAVLAVDALISLLSVNSYSWFMTSFLPLVFCGVYIVFGLLGNYIYMRHLENKATQAKALREPYKAQFLSSNGGINIVAAVLTAVGRVTLAIILLI